MSRKYFEEEQRFTQVWLWIILVLTTVFIVLPLAAALYVQLIEGRPFGENPAPSDTLLIIFFIVMVLSVVFNVVFWRTRLITVVDSQSVSVRFPPFFTRAKVFPSNTIAEYKIRTYRPVREYGGWGVRFALGKGGKAYTAKGKVGLQLVFRNGTKVLIGTQRAVALARAMQKMMEEREDV